MRTTTIYDATQLVESTKIEGAYEIYYPDKEPPCLLEGMIRRKWREFRHLILKKLVQYLKNKNILVEYYGSTRRVIANRVTIDLYKIEDELYKNTSNLRMIYNEEAEMIIVGGEEYSTLSSSHRFQIPPDFHSSIRFNESVLQYRGITVCLIPWFEGVLVVPKHHG